MRQWFGSTYVPSASRMPKRSASPSVARPRRRFSDTTTCDERGEVLLVALRREAAEVRVAVPVDELDVHARVPQKDVEVAARRAEARVDGHAEVRLPKHRGVDEAREPLEVRAARVDRVRRRRRRRRRVRLRRLRDLGLDARRDVGQRGRAVGRRELDAVVLGRIVRGREVDAARGAEAPDREGDDRRRHVAVRAQGADAFADENAGGLVHEPLVQETRVRREDEAR